MNKTDNNKHAICQLNYMKLQKEVKSYPKQPSYKRKCVAPKNAVVWNPKRWPRNSCYGRLKVKNFNNNSGEFGAVS